MKYTTEMKIEDQVIAIFRAAVINPENTLNSGKLDWSFIESDVFIDVKEADLKLSFDLGGFVDMLIDEQIEFGFIEDNTADREAA
jgi:hypothetical protein|tara:strand:- start:446 stop:700 length:255 start_codon:yes stop_codon:yes gene_type:complete